jgi:hypothetical protein
MHKMMQFGESVQLFECARRATRLRLSFARTFSQSGPACDEVPFRSLLPVGLPTAGFTGNARFDAVPVPADYRAWCLTEG